MDKKSMSDLENLAHNITYLRKHYGLSKKDMSDMLGISTKTLNALEKGEIPSRLTVDIIINV